MKKAFALGATLLLFGTGIVGCSKTAEGAAADATDNANKVADTTAKAADATKDAATKVADATTNAADKAVDAGKNAAGKVADATANAADATAAAAGKAVDATKNAAGKVADATANAADAAGHDLKGAGAGLVLTPKVKLAITNDPKLNDSRNMINIDSTADTVYIKGHVTDNDSKKRAEEIVTKVVTDAKGHQKVENQLTVDKH